MAVRGIGRHAPLRWRLPSRLRCVPHLPPAAAQEMVAFDVAPQPLGDALTPAARQAGVQTVFTHDAVRGRTSQRLRGRMTVRGDRAADRGQRTADRLCPRARGDAAPGAGAASGPPARKPMLSTPSQPHAGSATSAAANPEPVPSIARGRKNRTRAAGVRDERLFCAPDAVIPRCAPIAVIKRTGWDYRKPP